MQAEKAKAKAPNAKVKAEHIPQGYAQSGGESLPCPLEACETKRSKSRLLSLLHFGFCVLTFAFAFCLLPVVVNAQGCAMCYNSASAAKAGAKEALANGVLILLVPPMVFFVVIAVVVYMYRNKFRETSDGRPKQESSWGIEEVADFRLPTVDFPDSQSAILNRKLTMGEHSPWVR